MEEGTVLAALQNDNWHFAIVASPTVPPHDQSNPDTRICAIVSLRKTIF